MRIGGGADWLNRQKKPPESPRVVERLNLTFDYGCEWRFDP
jgi:hypothetical protein